jgi:hypothetical protein
MNLRSRKGGGTVFWDDGRGCYTGQLSHYDEAGNRKRPKVYAASDSSSPPGGRHTSRAR